MFPHKLLSAEIMANTRDELALCDRKLVFTNGCFDLLHVGHVRYLQAARDLGDALVVGLNGDESVRDLKGNGRPINSEHDRAEVLCALTCVDYVTIFHHMRVTELVRKVRPHIYAKGGDYTIESLNVEEVAALQEVSCDIKILPLVAGHSTTNIIKKWRS